MARVCSKDALVAYLFIPSFSSARGMSRFCMNQRHTLPVRMFSELRRIMPALMPMTSVSIRTGFGIEGVSRAVLAVNLITELFASFVALSLRVQG